MSREDAVAAPARLTVREADLEDAPRLTPVASRSTGGDGDEAAVAVSVATRLSIEPGDDYFVLVAEEAEAGRVVGWCAAGGSRGQELKGWGEIYTLELLEDRAGEAAALALVAEVVERLTAACFGAIALWVDPDDEGAHRRAERAGFAADSSRRRLDTIRRKEALYSRRLPV